MTVRELAEIAGVSVDTIRRTGNKLYPGMSIQGSITRYTDKQSKTIMQEVKKKNMVSETPQQNTVVPHQNTVVDYEIIGKMIGMAISAALVPVVQELKNIKQPLQLTAPKEDYFSLVGYTSLNGIKTNRSELAMHGMTLKKMAKLNNFTINQIPDERWGKVNSYPVELLDEYFSV